MGFKCGIVGLPNVGKSTLFNALTQAGAQVQNYPFCTIDPNIGVVFVPDIRLNKIAALVKSRQAVPTTIQFVDIAGLVAGASRGEGLGNRFLAHIRETDAIAHVVRCFEDPEVAHVTGKTDPLEDMEAINTELALADLEAVDKALYRARRAAKADKDSVVFTALLERVRQQLDTGRPVRALALSQEERGRLQSLHLLTAKPALYIANVAEDGFENNPWLDRIRQKATREGAGIVPVCAAIEAELASLEATEKTEFLSALGIEEPGLDRVIRAGYRLLDLQTFFTAGPKEVRAWTIPAGATAPQAAAVIHTDFRKGFIRAEVIAYEDFIACGGEQGAKEAGKWHLEGKDYKVRDGDIARFRFNV